MSHSKTGSVQSTPVHRPSPHQSPHRKSPTDNDKEQQHGHGTPGRHSPPSPQHHGSPNKHPKHVVSGFTDQHHPDDHKNNNGHHASPPQHHGGAVRPIHDVSGNNARNQHPPAQQQHGHQSMLIDHNGHPPFYTSNYSESINGARKAFTGQTTFAPHGSRDGSSHSGLTDGSDDKEDGNNVNVVIRVRPLTKKENPDGRQEPVLDFPGNGQLIINNTGSAAMEKEDRMHSKQDKNGMLNKWPKSFTFNMVFEPDASQVDVFENSGVKHLIDKAIDGFSCTVFAYGQTGSGKTFTISGPPSLMNHGKLSPAGSGHHGDSDDHHGHAKLAVANGHEPDREAGIMQRSFHYLFQQLGGKAVQNYELQASFLEIYNEQVKDLLNPSLTRHNLTVRWAKLQGFHVENLFEVQCFEEDDVLAVMEEGLRARQVAANNLNETSSRSHCILTIKITSEIRDPEDENIVLNKHGKLTFVDLAGSEKVREKNTSQGSLNETNKINRSLLTLGKCISALGDPKKKEGHIPYRDSKLTKLLKESLGGNGVTLMIACISPAKDNVSETLNTLYYAARTKKIKNIARIVLDPREQLIQSLKREVKFLRAENAYLKEQVVSLSLRRSILKDMGFHLVVLDKLKDSVEKGHLHKDLSLKEIQHLVQDTVRENENLREETSELLKTKEFLIRDQELVCRENERLMKKLESLDKNASLSPGHSSLSNGSKANSLSDLESGFISRGSPGNGRPPLSFPSRPPHHLPHPLPEPISKEMNRRRIGESGINAPGKGTAAGSTRRPSRQRRNSWGAGGPDNRVKPGKRQTAAPTGGTVRRSESDQHLRRGDPATGAGHGAGHGTGERPRMPAYETPLKPPAASHSKERMVRAGGDSDRATHGGRSN